MLRAWNGSMPLAGSTATLRIFSGECAATSSISTPPSVEPIKRDAPGVAVDQQAEIELTRDIAALLDIDPLDLAARRPGLVRHRFLPNSDARGRRDLLFRAAQLDPAGFAAPAGMDLRFDDPDLAAEPARRLDCLGGGIGHSAARHRDPEFRQQLFRLIFVDIHRVPPC